MASATRKDYPPEEQGGPVASDPGVRLTLSESGRLQILANIIHQKIRILYLWTQNNQKEIIAKLIMTGIFNLDSKLFIFLKRLLF